MAGLIQEQMQDPMAAGEVPPEPMQEGQVMAGEVEEGEDDDGPDENDPAFVAAIQFGMQALYENGAAQQIAQSLKAAPTPVQGLSDTAYEITSIVDERTEGQVPDELIVLLGMKMLEEVADIGEAAGVAYKASDVAEAFKTMLLRFLGEQGLDTTQLQAEMDKIDPAMFDQAAATEEA